ncbi:hypothetical protein MKZ38_000601 [Zalerion maritima]|uniref:Uncharacterized protein n=1 Tax=Zalerion maritima TaxID=339359 RepID=A0AAD5RSN3_9PEZI|nr:hypothetical protein MKZ38_000601 [Zalerion maritima]
MLRHAVRPIDQHALATSSKFSTSYRKRSALTLMLRDVFIANQRLLHTSNIGKKAGGGGGGGGPGNRHSAANQCSPYVVAAGKPNGVYVANYGDSKTINFPLAASGYTCRLMVFRYHTWKSKYMSDLSRSPTPQREQIMYFHFKDRDVPLWVTTNATTQGSIKGIVRSLGRKRMRNALREALARCGYDLQGRMIGPGVTAEQRQNGPVLWGAIEALTYHPTEMASAEFQDVVAQFERYIHVAINFLKLNSTVGLEPGNYPSPTTRRKPPGSGGKKSSGGKSSGNGGQTNTSQQQPKTNTNKKPQKGSQAKGK